VSLTSLYMAVMMSDTRYVYALGLGLYSYTQFEIWCLPIIKFLVQITSI